MTIILIVVVFIVGLLLVPRLFGYQIYGVLSGSMEPKFHVGSVVYVNTIAPEEIHVGDAITFHLESNNTVVATHRVIEIDKAGRTFTTKGDANDVADGEPVAFERLIGKSEFSIPLLGYLALYIQTKQGIILGIGVLLFMIFLSLLGDSTKKEAHHEDKVNDQKMVEVNQELEKSEKQDKEYI